MLTPSAILSEIVEVVFRLVRPIPVLILVDILVAEPSGEALRERHDEGVLELRVDGRQRPARRFARLERVPPCESLPEVLVAEGTED